MLLLTASCKRSIFLWFNAECNDNGGKCNPGKANPAAAAAWSDCKSAAECSWAFRLNSATELERGSDDDVDDDDVVVFGGLIGQHEHNPGNP